MYSLTRVPEDIDWGYSHQTPTLVFGGQALGLRVVGSIIGVGVLSGGDAPQVFFDVEPLRAVDHEGMHRILDKASPIPRSSLFHSGLTWADVL